jgi:hypothetical protein
LSFSTGNGTARCLDTEAINLHTLGQVHIARGSHVEPDDRGQWWADLSPVCGPRLGSFVLRSEALQAEVEWLPLDHLPFSFRPV